mmetsp:Transcript_24421/g.35886  ORF Transcript_24421/g.35886 Transcript_24421/m.35886 type:complete len:594 (+) Transcript_24421:43-1824(+)
MEFSNVLVWVKYEMDESVQVSVPSGYTVSDLKVSIKSQLSPLSEYGINVIHLCNPEGEEGTDYDPNDQVSDIIRSGVGVTSMRPIRIRTTQRVTATVTGTARAEGPAVLKDGLPRLSPEISYSFPYIPKPAEHLPCDRVIKSMWLLDIGEHITEYRRNRVLNGEPLLCYRNESDIVFYVRVFLLDIIAAMKLNVYVRTRISVTQIRPDICVLSVAKHLIGVVEVKKPGENILLQPTVMGDLFDEMLLVEGFYRMGPVCGILTSAEEWMVAWFPGDSTCFTDGKWLYSSETFSTPRITSPDSGKKTDDASPPGGTPSQLKGLDHAINPFQDDDFGLADITDNDDMDLVEEVERKLHTTRVYNIHSESEVTLQVVCTALSAMASAYLHHRPGLSQCLFKFHKDITSITWHPTSYEAVLNRVNFNRFPPHCTRCLIALEDLGRGSTCKSWLAVTTSAKHSAVCVLKFEYEADAMSMILRTELKNWKLLYPEFASMTAVEVWSGSEALKMPYFGSIPETEREKFREPIRRLLSTKFGKKYVHPNVRWRSIGKYTNNDGERVPVLYDLHNVREYNEERDFDWIDAAILKLYPILGPLT